MALMVYWQESAQGTSSLTEVGTWDSSFSSAALGCC